jgi:hypothetical protein
MPLPFATLPSRIAWPAVPDRSAVQPVIVDRPLQPADRLPDRDDVGGSNLRLSQLSEPSVPTALAGQELEHGVGRRCPPKREQRPGEAPTDRQTLFGDPDGGAHRQPRIEDPTHRRVQGEDG